MQNCLRVTFWIVLILIFGSSLFPYVDNKEYKIIMFSVYGIALLIEDGLMIAALLMMRSTIGRSNKGKINTKRMINHAAAYVLFSLAIVYNELSNFFSDKRFYYIDWLITAAIGTASMLCLYRLLWHLGTKEISDQTLI